MTNLTPKQQQIYQFIRASTQANGYPPTLREIGQQVGVRSPSTVKYHLDNLRTLGLLHWDGGKTRSITLPKDEMVPGPDQVPVLGNVAAGSPSSASRNTSLTPPAGTRRTSSPCGCGGSPCWVRASTRMTSWWSAGRARP